MAECYILAWVRSIDNKLVVDEVGFYSDGPGEVTHALHREAPLTVASFKGESFDIAHKQALHFANYRKGIEAENNLPNTILGKLCALALECEAKRIFGVKREPLRKNITLWDHLTKEP